MLNRRNTYTLILCVAMLVFAGQFSGYAQNIPQLPGQESPYGTQPPVDGEEQGEQTPQDTTEKKLRKPLESYYFNDSIRALKNFMWNIDMNFNRVNIMPIDTTLTSWRLDYPHLKEEVGDASVGALGQATLPMNYFRRSTNNNFSFASPYDAYTYRSNNTPFYNVKTPFTLFTYLESGQKLNKEANFGIIHAQNISPSTGFNVDYKSRGTRGLYDWSDTNNKNLSVAISHTGKRYSVHAGYIHNTIDREENGGVVGTWAIVDTVYQLASGTPTKLATSQATNKYRNNSFYVTQAYAIPLQAVTDSDFTVADLSAFYVGHSFEYNSWRRIYSDINQTYTDERAYRDPATGEFVSEERSYYKDWFINPLETRDSTIERMVSNRIYIQAQPWGRDAIVGTVDGGIGVDLHTYSQFAMNDYLTGEQGKVNKTSYFVYGSAVGKFRQYLNWGAQAKFYPTGYRGGDLSVGGNLALTGYLRGHPLTLSGAFSLDKRSASYWQENLFSNHYVWFSPLNQELETRLEVKLSIPSIALEAGAWQSVVTDKIYYDTNSHIAQSSDNVSITSFYLQKNFRLGGFNLEHRVLLQNSTNHRVVPVPAFSAFLSYYYEFWTVRDVLRMQIGLDGRYNTAYYAPGYNPALSTFYNQQDEEYGGYPYVDAFVAGKWKRMRILLKYQHANLGLFGNGEYFTVAGYPLNPGMFRIGISWGFYD